MNIFARIIVSLLHWARDEIFFYFCWYLTEADLCLSRGHVIEKNMKRELSEYLFNFLLKGV